MHKVLFPLSAERLPDYLRRHGSDSDTAAQIDELKKRVGGAADNPLEVLQDFIKRDVKDTTLKWIQGRIWREAFEDGSVRGHVYADVPGHFRRWKERCCRIFIYSSGSVEAQQLLFRYSEAGDLSLYLDGYFDTTTGMKRDADSYRKIAVAAACNPQQMLFLSDISEELAAAKQAGMQTCLLLREDAAAPAGYDGHHARDFAEVDAAFF